MLGYSFSNYFFSVSCVAFSSSPLKVDISYGAAFGAFVVVVVVVIVAIATVLFSSSLLAPLYVYRSDHEHPSEPWN